MGSRRWPREHSAGPSARAVKQRMRAIKNIGKITKAMKMVAASKMKNAQVAVEQSRGIVNPFVRLFGDYPGGLACGDGPRSWDQPGKGLLLQRC